MGAQLLRAVATRTSELLIAEDVDGEALATLVLNSMRGVIETCAASVAFCRLTPSSEVNTLAAVSTAISFKPQPIDKDHTTTIGRAGRYAPDLYEKCVLRQQA